MSKIYGKAFESELETSCKNLRCWNHSSNSVVPACDRIACVPVHLPDGLVLGLSMMLEAKECRDDSFDLVRITKNERTHLNSHHRAGGISVVLLKSVCNRPRVFGCQWSDWLEMEDGLGFDYFSTTRRKSGTASISLRDGERPFTFVELARIERPNGLGKCWDLSPLLPVGVAWAHTLKVKG